MDNLYYKCSVCSQYNSLPTCDKCNRKQCYGCGFWMRASDGTYCNTCIRSVYTCKSCGNRSMGDKCRSCGYVHKV